MGPCKDSGGKNILLTGLPGIGKTTVIKGVARALKNFHPAGFYTEEIRERGVRKGFKLISFDGRKALLSHVDLKSPFGVGKYGVDVGGFEGFLRNISLGTSMSPFIIIDEIGKMECLSDVFKGLIVELLNSKKSVIATIALKGSSFLEGIRRREDATLFEVTRSNREELVPRIIEYALEDL